MAQRFIRPERATAYGVRDEQLEMADVEAGLGELLHRHHGRVPQAALEVA